METLPRLIQETVALLLDSAILGYIATQILRRVVNYKPSPTGQPRGKCPKCGKIITLKANGKLRSHYPVDPRVVIHCSGSNQYPKE